MNKNNLIGGQSMITNICKDGTLIGIYRPAIDGSYYGGTLESTGGQPKDGVWTKTRAEAETVAKMFSRIANCGGTIVDPALPKIMGGANDDPKTSTK